jgi:hypothetical protein
VIKHGKNLSWANFTQIHYITVCINSRGSVKVNFEAMAVIGFTDIQNSWNKSDATYI